MGCGGKTHLLIDCANFLKDEFARRAIQEPVIVRVSALGVTPSRWYRDLLGIALDNHGGRTADGGLFTRLILQVYSIAAKSLLANDAIKTDSLNYHPAVAMRLIKEGLLNATSVWGAFDAILRECCAHAPDTVREHFVALMDVSSRARSERWLAGGEGDAGADAPSDQEAAGILAATAALCGVARWPFALFIDEIEQFLRKDDRSGSEVNTTWLKRLLVDLVGAGAFVAIGGHVSAWVRRREFLDRFSGGTRRIEMRRLEGSDVLDQVSDRVGTGAIFDPVQAEVVAEVCNGNMRRILALCRVLYDRSRKFTMPLTEQDIRERAAELGQALTRDQALLNIREMFETRGYAVRQEMKDGGTRFDLVARDVGGTAFVVIVRSTPEVKEAQDLAIHFVRQINANRLPSERVHAFFVCDTPEDRGVQAALRDSLDIDFTWINYTDPETLSAIRRAIDRDAAVPPPAVSAADIASQLEAAVNRRLDELDRQRSNELNALYERLADAERRAIPEEVDPEPEGESATAYRMPPGPAASQAPPPLQFSAADLLAKPGLDFRLRTLMSSTGSWVELIFFTLGLFVIAVSSRLPGLWVHAPPVADVYSSPEARQAMDAYNRTVDTLSLDFLVAGIVIAVITGLLLFRRYLAVESYFDYANQLIKEEYLVAPHPWLLAGANRITRQLALVYDPREAIERLPGEIENLVHKRGMTVSLASVSASASADWMDAPPS
jgi:hypothetical protein